MADNFNYKEAFDELLPRSLTMSHFDLAEVCDGSTASGWKNYLSKPDVKKRIAEDMELVRKASLNQLIKDAGDSNSVGKSQLMSSLVTYGKQVAAKEGPVFIYSHVPLQHEAAYSPSVGRMEGRKIEHS